MAAWTALLALGACATLPKAQVAPAAGGGLDVRVTEEQSVRALAVTVYDDVALAAALAEAAGIPADQPVAAGTALHLPTKDELTRRIAADERARELQEEGRRAERDGDWAKAAGRYREAMALRPDLPQVRHALGVALLRSGNLEEALSLLAEGSLLHPYDAETRYAYGAALREKGDLAGALQELDAAVELDEHHARARYDRARTLQELGRSDDAARAYREFLFAFPDDPWAEDARRALDGLGGR
jgi:tetratricopeptide (TPR) repeat protein